MQRRGERVEIAVAGGAALVLLFNARETTRDVDAYVLRPEGAHLRDAARSVAYDLGLPEDWLNDGAKAYFVRVSSGEVLHESAALVVRAVSTTQLLAMKVAAWRDAIDRADARLLLTRTEGSREEIWTMLEPFVPRHLIDKASYAFDDLWEAIHGYL